MILPTVEPISKLPQHVIEAGTENTSSNSVSTLSESLTVLGRPFSRSRLQGTSVRLVTTPVFPWTQVFPGRQSVSVRQPAVGGSLEHLPVLPIRSMTGSETFGETKLACSAAGH